MIGYVNDITYNYFVKPQYNIEKLNENILQVKEDVSKINKETIQQKQEESTFLEKLQKSLI